MLLYRLLAFRVFSQGGRNRRDSEQWIPHMEEEYYGTHALSILFKNEENIYCLVCGQVFGEAGGWTGMLLFCRDSLVFMLHLEKGRALLVQTMCVIM